MGIERIAAIADCLRVEEIRTIGWVGPIEPKTAMIAWVRILHGMMAPGVLPEEMARGNQGRHRTGVSLPGAATGFKSAA